jgi:hypothetical protein
MADHPHPAPDRTARRDGRGAFADVECQIWTSRGAMLAACRMSDHGIGGAPAWRPLIREAPAV